MAIEKGNNITKYNELSSNGKPAYLWQKEKEIGLVNEKNTFKITFFTR